MMLVVEVFPKRLGKDIHKKNEPPDAGKHRKALNMHSSSSDLATLLDSLTGRTLRFDTAIRYSLAQVYDQRLKRL